VIRYPLHRPEHYDRLRRGEAMIFAAMAENQLLCRRGQHIFRISERHDLVYRVRTGWLCRTRILEDGRRQCIILFLPGELCAVQCSLFSQQPDTVECLTEATLECIEQERLQALADEHPDVALRLMLQLAEEQRRLHNWVVALGRGTAEERLAAFFLELRARSLHLNLGSGRSFSVHLTQPQLADHVGLTPVHVNRTLREFRERGIMLLKGRVAIINDAAALRRIAAPMLDVYDLTAAEFAADEA
jgi:CRP/FNR family transcriptional regulator